MNISNLFIKTAVITDETLLPRFVDFFSLQLIYPVEIGAVLQKEAKQHHSIKLQPVVASNVFIQILSRNKVI